jgi:type II secretory pathway pseudopilin PulG
MMRNFLIGLVGCLVLSTQAKAELSANEALANAAQRAMKTYVSGIATGIGWANTHQENKGQPIFCQPRKLALTDDQTIDILRRYVEQHPEYGGHPVGVILLEAFMVTFACPK